MRYSQLHRNDDCSSRSVGQLNATIEVLSRHSQLCHHTFDCERDWTFHLATGGTFVSTAAEALGHLRNVHVSLAAQAYPKTTSRHFPEEQCDFDIFDTQRSVG